MTGGLLAVVTLLGLPGSANGFSKSTPSGRLKLAATTFERINGAASSRAEPAQVIHGSAKASGG